MDRRDFLKVAGIGAVTALAGLHFLRDQPDDSPLEHSEELLDTGINYILEGIDGLHNLPIALIFAYYLQPLLLETAIRDSNKVEARCFYTKGNKREYIKLESLDEILERKEELNHIIRRGTHGCSLIIKENNTRISLFTHTKQALYLYDSRDNPWMADVKGGLSDNVVEKTAWVHDSGFESKGVLDIMFWKLLNTGRYRFYDYRQEG